MYPLSLFIVGIIGFLISILFTAYVFKRKNVKGKAILPSLFILISSFFYLGFYALGMYDSPYSISITFLILGFLFTLVALFAALHQAKDKIHNSK